MTSHAAAATVVIRATDRPAPASWSTGRRIPRPDHGFDDGAWAAWQWDGRTLTAQTSPHGSIPVYYAVMADGIVMSPWLDGVLAAGIEREFDWEALAVGIRIGGYLEERTPFRAIRILPPGADFRWSEGLPAIRSTVRNDPPAEEPLTFDRAVDAYLELVATAVRRRQPDAPFALPLSGGRDSRHILLELLRQGHRPAITLTSRHYLVDSSTDVLAASILARRVNVPHEVLAVPPYSLARHADVIRRIDYTTYDHAWALTLADRLRSFSISYDGQSGTLFGRVLHGSRENVALAQAGRYDELVDRILEPSRWIDAYLTGDVRDRLSVTVAAHALHGELKRYHAWPNPFLGYWHWNRGRRYTSIIPFVLCRAIPTVFAPLDDYDVVRFALSLPAEVSTDNRLQIAALRRAFPDLADVPFVDELWARRGSAWYAQRRRHLDRAKYAIDLLRLLHRRGSGMVDARGLSRLASTTWLLGRGAHYDKAPPITYLLTVEESAMS